MKQGAPLSQDARFVVGRIAIEFGEKEKRMTKQRFEELTGIYISEYQYGIIEEFYLQDGYSDEEFCDRYKKNENGLAQSIQRVTDIVAAQHEERMRKQLEEQQRDLDRLLAAKPDPVMERVKCKDAAKELNMDIVVMQYLLRQDRLPIGYAVKREGKGRAEYYIYRGQLDEYKRRLQGKSRGKTKEEVMKMISKGLV